MKTFVMAAALCVPIYATYASDAAAEVSARSSTQHGAQTDIAIDGIDDVPVTGDSVVSGIARGTTFHVTGWAVDARRRRRAAGVLAALDGRAPLEVTYGLPTPQVAAMFHTGAYAAAGYRVAVTTANVALGLHHVFFYVSATGGKGHYPAQRSVSFEIVPPGMVRPIVIGDGRHIVGSLDQVTTVDRAFAYGTETGAVWLPKTALLFLRGWAVDVVHRREVTRYVLTIDGDRSPVVHAGDLRPELAKTFPNLPEVVASYAGFTAIVPLARFPAGVHRLGLTAIDPQTGEHKPLLKEFWFATYDAMRLPKAVRPGYGPTRPIAFHRDGLTGSVDIVTTYARSRDYNRQALPVWADSHDALFIQGWGVDLKRDAGLGAAFAVIDGRRRFPVKLGEPRPDVAQAYPRLTHAAAHSGYSVVIPMRGLSAGTHNVTLRAVVRPGHAATTLLANFPFSVF